MSITYRFATPLPGAQDSPGTEPVTAGNGSHPEGDAGAPGLAEAQSPWRDGARPVVLSPGPVLLSPNKDAEAPMDTDAAEGANPPLLLDRARRVDADQTPTGPQRVEPQDDASTEQPEAVAPQAAAADPSAPVHLPVKWTGKRGHLILVARSRGGMGATSIAVNLALELVRHRGLFRSGAKRRVALLDLDVQFGTAGSIMDVEDTGGMLALARMVDEPDRQAVGTAMVKHKSGVDVLPAPKRTIPLDALDATRVGSIIDPLLADYDFVVVDLPHALVRWMEPLLMQADRLLMVTDLAVPSVVTARRVIDLMREDNASLNVEIVVTREKKPLYPGKLQRDAAEALGLPLTHWIPVETELSRKAFDRGEPLVDLSPRCPWSRALRKLAQHIETDAEAAKTNQRG